jgi:hypothetical protein
VLSCIAGIAEDTLTLGLATGSEFLLARTEIAAVEIHKEEVWWMMAVEWADKNGAHIINSSLGYGAELYHPFHMDGKSAFITRAANMAASKGILVVNSAGNEGLDRKWTYSIIAPADADSVLSVGGIMPISDLHVNFSSIGPTVDGRLKPNVVAFGWANVAVGNSSIGLSAGTSFSAPLVTGFAACAWQTNRNLNNIQLKTEIEHSGDLYPYFDYDHGYGIPQASYFMDGKTSTDSNLLSFVETDTTIQVLIDQSLDKEYADKKKYRNQSYIYYHIQDEKGLLVKYLVLSLPESFSQDTEIVTQEVQDELINTIDTDKPQHNANEEQKDEKCIVAQIEKQELKQGYIFRVYYNGLVKEYSH